MKHRYLSLLICFSLEIAALSFCSAQTHEIDSLRRRLKTDQDDTKKVKDLNGLAFAFYPINPDTTLLLTRQSSTLAQTLGWKKGEANAYINEGIGYCVKGNYPNGLDNFLKALTICLQLGNKHSAASVYSNIATIYDQQGDYKKALEYNEKALSSAREIKYRQLEANTLGNMGVIFREQNDFPKALDYYNQSLAINKDLGNKGEMAIQLGNIGNIYLYRKEYTEALKYSIQASVLDRQSGDKSSLGYQLDNIGTIYLGLKNYKQAKIQFDSALDIAKQIDEKYLEKNVYGDMAALDSTTGNYKAAFEDHKKYFTYNDSLLNESNTKKTVQAEMTFSFEQKQAAEKAEQDKKDAIAEADKRKQRIITWTVAGGLLSVIVLAGFIFRSLRITRKQKQDIERKNHIIEEKNKDILDSIHYASRIQRALLTTDEYIGNHLKEYFILFKPRDIVSGDFYWAFHTPGNGAGLFHIACCDCTGHGVPGAFMSLLNISMLNEAVIERKITQPNLVLDDVRTNIIKALNPKGLDTESKDGMDCSLCTFNFANNTIDITCANNPIWVVRSKAPSRPSPSGKETEAHKILPNGEDLGGAVELVEILPDKMPVGIQYGEQKPFSLHTIKVTKGDCIYMFTDGYADQFGGPKGKKFKYRPLQEKLLAISQQPLAQQKQILEQTLNEWQGNLEQVDDILIIGIKI